MRGRRVRAGFLAALLGLSLVATSAAGAAPDRITLEDAKFTAVNEQTSFAGNTESLALHLRLLDQELTVADGTGAAAFSLRRTEEHAPEVSSDLFMPCTHASSVTVGGSQQCLDGEKLREQGLNVGDFPVAQGAGPQIAVSDLEQAGIADIIQVGEDLSLTGVSADAEMLGLLVPNLSEASASCAATASDEVVTVPVPDPLTPVVAGNLAFARCATSVDGFPSAVHETGEAVLDVTLNQTLIPEPLDLEAAVDELKGLIAPLPEEIKEPLETALDNIVERLSEQPVVKVRVAPTRGELVGGNPSLTASSVARGATIDILPLNDLPVGELDGVIQITVGEATASASVADGVPEASNTAAIIRVKVLDITSEDPDAILLDIPIGPLDVDQTLLADTPLQTTIKAANAPDPVTVCEQVGDLQRCTASAEAQSLTISIFDPVLVSGDTNPLPNTTIEIASAGAFVQANIQELPAAGVLPVELPRTGALPLAAVLGGLGLLAVAGVVRRRFGT